MTYHRGMSTKLAIELASANRFGPCACCGGTSVRLTRFVSRDGDAHAVYYATFANNHPEHELHMLVSIGEWGDGSEASQRAAFFCRLRATEDAYQVMLDDAKGSPWSEVELVGHKLSQSEARAHPRKAEVFEITDEAVRSDPQVKGFLERVRCGDPSVPLEYSFALPDEVFALDAQERERRATIGKAFVALDSSRCFVRCLVPIPVEGHGEWSAGIWVELAPADVVRVLKAWNDAAGYAALRFTGTTANSLEALGLPMIRTGVHVTAGVSQPEQPPRVVDTTDPDLAERLRTTWPREAFEEFALERGFL